MRMKDMLDTQHNHYDQNRDAIKQKVRQYYTENKALIRSKNKERVCCPTCGVEIAKSSMSRHNKTKHPTQTEK